MSPITITHPLDWGNHYHLVMDYDPVAKKLSGHITGPAGSTGTVERHLATLIALQTGDKPYRLSLDNRNKWSFTASVNGAGDDALGIAIRLGGKEHADGELYGHYRIHNSHIESREIKHRLTVFETRMLGNECLYRWLPYPREKLEPPLQRTDLHTHSSAQISAQGLIDVALANHIAYPTRLLDLLHIDYPAGAVILAEAPGATRRFRFPPTDGDKPIDATEDAVPLSALAEKECEKLKAALAIPPDRQMTFGDLEMTVYRYRTPISKHPDAAYDLLLQTAREYQKQGIVYAEITATSTSLLTPEYLKLLHEKLPEIEHKTGVRLRFLVGIPRNLPLTTLSKEIGKLELMGTSPYIVGVDFMGFEDNKINDMERYIAPIAAWAKENDPEFTLRIHAGENRKNMSNVRESLRLAEKYNMRVRIGHAAHGLDDDALDIAENLAKKNLAMIEFNPDSNLALNNIDTAEELDMLRCLGRRIPFVICSDGGGLYQTDARQLWLAASFAAGFAGVEPDRVASIIQSENDHMQREDARFERKYRKLPKDFLENIKAPPVPAQMEPFPSSRLSREAFEQHLQKHAIAFAREDIETATRDKKPLMILGATGERYWNMISASHKRQIHDAIDMLVAQLDPRKVYFMIGRPKDEGITALLSRAVQKYNGQHNEGEKFALVSATVQADQTAHSFTPGLTHVLPLTGSLFTVPDQLVNYASERDGHILLIGGGTFVRDAILLARDKHVAFGLMRGPEGASSDKAVMMNPNRQFEDAQGLIDHLNTAHPEWFKLPFRSSAAPGRRP